MCIQTITYSPPYSLTRRLQKYEKRKKKKNLGNLQMFPKQLQPLGRLHKNGDLPYDFVICNFLSFAQK